MADTTNPMGPYEPGPPLPNPIPGVGPGRGFAVGAPGAPAPAKKKKGKSLAAQVGGAIEHGAEAAADIPAALWHHFTNPGIALQNAMSSNPGTDPKPGTPEAAAMAAAGQAAQGDTSIGGVTPDLIQRLLTQSEAPNVEMLNTLGGLFSGKGAAKGSPLAALAKLLGPTAGSKTGKGVGEAMAGLGTAATQAAPAKALQQFLQWLPTASGAGGAGLIGSSDLGSTGANDPVNQSTAALLGAPKAPGQ